MTAANSLDPEQDRQNISPDMDPTHLASVNGRFFWKSILKFFKVRRWQQKHEKLPVKKQWIIFCTIVAKWVILKLCRFVLLAQVIWYIQKQNKWFTFTLSHNWDTPRQNQQHAKTRNSLKIQAVWLTHHGYLHANSEGHPATWVYKVHLPIMMVRASERKENLTEWVDIQTDLIFHWALSR